MTNTKMHHDISKLMFQRYLGYSMRSAELIDCVATFYYPKYGLKNYREKLKILVEKDATKVVDENKTIVYEKRSYHCSSCLNALVTSQR